MLNDGGVGKNIIYICIAPIYFEIVNVFLIRRSSFECNCYTFKREVKYI